MIMTTHKSCLAATEIWSGKKRCALWQDKMSVVTRRDLCCGKTQGMRPSAASTKGGGQLRRPTPFVVPLCLATTEVSSCHSRHLVLPQRTSFLAAPDIRRGQRGCPQSRIPNPIGDCENGQTKIRVPSPAQISPASIVFFSRLEIGRLGL